MLLAVLEKRLGFKFGTKDVFLNIAGGLRVDDPAIDLAVVAALLSSYQDQPLKTGLVFAAEVGLSGELRPVSRLDQRIQESGKLGYKRIIVSEIGKSQENPKGEIEVLPAAMVGELLQIIF
jgi:DNA repair protein RadA/Sms